MTAAGRRHFPITLTIVSLFGGVVVLLLALVIVLSFLSNLQGTLKLIARLATQSNGYVVDELRDHLDPVVELGDWTASLIAAPSFDSKDRQRLGDTLVAALAATPQITGLVHLHVDGSRLLAFRGAPGEGPRLDNGDDKNQAFVDRTFALAQQTKEGFWNEILYSETLRSSYVNHVTPVWHNDRFEGVVLAAVSLNELSVLVSDISDTLRGTVFVLVGKDRVIAHPNLTSPHPDLSIDNPIVGIDHVGDLVLAEFWSAKTHPIAEELGLKDITIRRADIDGQRFVFSSLEITDYGTETWVVGAYLDAETAEAQLRALRNSALIGVLALFLGGTLAIFVGRAVARPIKTASSGIAHIAQLDLADVKPLPPSRFSELDAQANAFNAMLGALRWFQTYVPRSLVRRLISRGEGEIASETRELSILFTDLVGFTATSEALSARETAELLNHHFALLGACIEAEAGTIDKFIGDALMAFWGAPEQQSDHAARALRAAKAMAKAVHDDNRARCERGLPPVRMRLGLHCGPAVVGNIGAPERMNYTVVGDSVNTAQRMESLGKEVAPEAEIVIVASQAIITAAGPQAASDPAFTAAGTHLVKGKSEPLRVFSLTL